MYTSIAFIESSDSDKKVHRHFKETETDYVYMKLLFKDGGG